MPLGSGRKARASWAAALVSLLALGVSLPAANAAAVKFGDLGIVGDGPFYIAQEKGYFTHENLEVIPESFDSAAGAPLPLATNQLQVIVGGLGAGLFNAFARDLPLRIVMGNTRAVAGFAADALMLRADLKDEITTIAGLKGRSIAINAPAGTYDYLFGKMLQASGMGLQDVDLKYLSFPSQGAAFANRAIDAGGVSEPFATLYAEKNLAFPFKRADELVRDPPLQISVVLYSKAWIDAAPDEAEAFALAYLKGIRDYYDAMKGGPKRSEVVDILARHTALKDKPLYDRIRWAYMDPNGDITMASLEDQVAWFNRRGQITGAVDVARMVDRRYLDYAQAKLGRVGVP